MLNSMPKRLVWALIFLACLAASAPAADMVNAGSYGPPMGGVYTSPYLIRIDGVPVWVICDDFEGHLASQWTANETSLSSILNASQASQIVAFDRGDLAKQKADYLKVAMLAAALLQPNVDATHSEALSYAIWAILDPKLLARIQTAGHPTGYGYLSDTVYALVMDYLQATPTGPIPEMLIYTPVVAGASQEFLRVNVAEAASLAILAVDLLSLAGLIVFARRRLVQFPRH